MSRRLLLPCLSLVFLALAVVSGVSVTERVHLDRYEKVRAIGSGLDRLKSFIAGVLYLQLDDYHHIGMYQGVQWSSVTDYLPQMWLIARLDPHFTVIYNDAAYQLAINLGQVEQGMAFMEEGVRNNPESLDVRYHYAYLLWETGTGTPEQIRDELMVYRTLLRRRGGDQHNPYWEAASATLMAEVYETLSDTASVYRNFYRRRAAFIHEANRAGLYYPGYLGETPHYLTSEDGH